MRRCFAAYACFSLLLGGGGSLFGRSIPLRCMVIGDDDSTSYMEISNMVVDVNRVFRQVAMSFEVESCVRTNDFALQVIYDTNTTQRAKVYALLPNGNGLKLFL